MQWIVLVVVFLASSVVTATPAFAPTANAQVSHLICTITDQTTLESCITSYNEGSSGVTVTLEFANDVSLSDDLPAINNTSVPPAHLTIEGGGHTLFGDGSASVIFEQDAGSTSITNITLAGATSAGLRVDGGIWKIYRSTIAANDGFGVLATGDADVLIENSTIHNNIDGLGVVPGTAVSLQSSTVTGNEVRGIVGANPSVRIGSSLIGGHGTRFDPDTSDCDSATVTDDGFNRFEDDSCNGDATFLLRDSFSTTLADNGCSQPCTQTIALLPQSPAIDADTNCAANSTDQRGLVRTSGKCDAGAFEFGDCPNAHSVDDDADLRLAINCYNQAPAGATVLATVTDSFDSSGATIFNEEIPAPLLVIDGNGHTISGASLGQLDGDTRLNELTLNDSEFTAFGLDGGNAIITGSTITGHRAGIFVEARSDEPRLQLIDSTIFGNTGQGVAMELIIGGSVEIIRSTITGNADEGVSSFANNGTLTIEGSLIAGNNQGDVNQCSSLEAIGSANVVSDDTCIGAATPGLEGSFDTSLADNGCTQPCTQTIALLPDSPAIDADANCVSGLTDQRGVDRTPGKCDAGSFEFGDGALCEGLPVTIDMNLNGGIGDGTAGPDVILGTPGDDEINGLSGDDVICAGHGNDDIFGGPGADTIIGNLGADFIEGGDHDDTIYGGEGDDTIYGGSGADTIIGNPGNDSIEGGDQADTINGGGGNDVILGGNGFDRITGSTGNDTIIGGNGNDWVWAGPGVDDISGGPGNDLLLGFDGNDTIDAGGGNDLMNGMNGDDDVEGGDGFDQIWGGLGNDHLKGQGGFDWIWGRWGEDTIEGGYGNDRLFGEGSADLIYGGPGNDLINGGIGTDDLRGNDGDDIIEGGDQSDTMFGGPGNDSFDGGFGTDSCDGNTGTDSAVNCEVPINIP